MIKKLTAASLASLIMLAACSQPKPTTETPSNPLIAEGKALVAENCVSCHVLGQDQAPIRADAPPLSLVLANYNPESLADDFREGIHVGHPDMPDFDFGARGTDAVIAYLQSIQISE